MKRNYLAHILSIGLIISVITGCKGLKKAQGDNVQNKATAILQKTKKEILKYEQLSLSGRARVEIPEMGIDGMSATYRISILKDDRIMIRISKIIEAFRILATQDSVYVLDKLNHNIIACDYQLVKQMIGIDANYDMLHDLLTGDFHPIPDRLQIAEAEGSNKKFIGEKAGIQFSYFINPEIHKVIQILADHTTLGHKTELNYGNFESYGDTQMPMSGSVRVQTDEAFSLDFEHRKVSIDPENLSIAFNIPDNYARMGCK